MKNVIVIAIAVYRSILIYMECVLAQIANVINRLLLIARVNAKFVSNYNGKEKIITPNKKAHTNKSAINLKIFVVFSVY